MLTESERRVKAIQQKLDRLDEAYLFAQTIDLTSYDRQRDKLREELTLAQINHHAESIEELDVPGHSGIRRARFTARGGPVGTGVA